MKRSVTLACILSPLVLIIIGMLGCKRQLIGPELSPGNLNLFRYIAIGDGFTAGVMNSDVHTKELLGLYEEGQAHSFPRLISNQFKYLEDIEFQQPVMSGNGSGYLQLTAISPSLCPATGSNPALEKMNPQTGWASPYQSSGLLNNVGIPNLKLSDLSQDSLVYANPFFNRINPHNLNFPDYVKETRPGFFTLWLGMEDLIAYALSGADDPATQPLDPESFGTTLKLVVDYLLLSAPEANGVVANLPDITLFPYFANNTYEYISPDNCNGTPRAIYITTESGIRAAGAEDHLLLPVYDHIGTSYGTGQEFGLRAENPVPEGWVLDKDEIAKIRWMVEGYNIKIKTIVSAINEQKESPVLTTVNLNYLFYKMSNGGYTEDGVEISNEYLTGGVFSLDGIYLTPRGYALVANAFIQEINTFSYFAATIPPINITDYPGVVFP